MLLVLSLTCTYEQRSLHYATWPEDVSLLGQLPPDAGLWIHVERPCGLTVCSLHEWVEFSSNGSDPTPTATQADPIQQKYI